MHRGVDRIKMCQDSGGEGKVVSAESHILVGRCGGDLTLYRSVRKSEVKTTRMCRWHLFVQTE